MKTKFSILLFFILSFGSYAQCAMCKAVVESGNISEAEGLNEGILYLMVFPYLLVGLLFYFILKKKKKSKI